MALADSEVMALVEAVATGTVRDAALATALAMARAEVAALEATVTEAATAAGMGVVIPPRLGAVASGAEDDCIGFRVWP